MSCASCEARGPFCPPLPCWRLSAHCSAGNGTNSVTVPVKPKRPLPVTDLNIGGRGAVGIKVEKCVVEEVMKQKVYSEVFGGGTGKIQDAGAVISWACN